MLVFGMKDADYAVIDGNIVVRVIRDGNEVKLCIDAPKSVLIERSKNYEQRCMREGTEPARKPDRLLRDAKKRLYMPQAPMPAHE